jgi:hypothetical protein
MWSHLIDAIFLLDVKLCGIIGWCFKLKYWQLKDIIVLVVFKNGPKLNVKVNSY